MSTNKRQ